MKKFYFKLLLLAFFLFGWIPFSFFLIAPQYTYGYNASFLDKINRLENIDIPKIVLIGNSNLAFGIQSDLIENEIGMPVVNLGFNGSLGNAFHERMPLFNLTEGDILVICHLDYSDDDKITEAYSAISTVENHFHYWKIFRLKDMPRIILTLPKYARTCLKRYINKEDIEPEEKSCYMRSAFNEYGDNIFPRNIEAGEGGPALRHPKVNDICMNRINNFYKFCKQKGIYVVIAGTPILSGLEGFNLDEYKQFQRKLEEYAECPIISDFTDYIFDKKYFYGDYKHMTNDGAKLRTGQLIKDLKRFIETDKVI